MSVPVRELIAGVPSPSSDHRKDKPPALLKQDFIDIGIVSADVVRHVRNIEFDWPTATRFEVDEERTVLRAEDVAWMGFAVQSCSAAPRPWMWRRTLCSVLRRRCRSASASAGVSSRFATSHPACATRSIKCGVAI